ncbi:MAG: DUF3108 domain-containing protein [Betaproteobacteria bacterium]|nr:DUF3108 domain-containing protein [Rubrivivax sp.]
MQIHGPSALRRGRPQARRWPLAAAVLAVVALAHGLALLSLAAAGSAVEPARAGPSAAEPAAAVSVRALPSPTTATPALPPDLRPTPMTAPIVEPVAAPVAVVRAEPPGGATAPTQPQPAAGGSDAATKAALGPAALAAAEPTAAATTPPAASPPPGPTPAVVHAPPTDGMAFLQVAATPVAAAATAAPQAGTPLPRYRVLLPPPFEARFDMRRGALSGQAQWRYATEGSRYRLELQTLVLGQNVSHLRSEGGSSAAGLEPLRFVDGRRGRDRRAVNFQRDAPGGPRISFSGPGHELPLPEGVQDRLSWLLQLAAIVDTDAALRRPGARVLMWVVSPRGEADVWTFEVTGAETLRGDDGRLQPALALQRKADRSLDTEVRVWLDPAAHHLPLRAAWRHDGEGPVVELRREALAWR